MFAVELFARPVFRLSVMASVASFVAQTLAYIALPFLFQSVFERSVLASGLLMVPWLIGTALMSPVAGHLSDRYDASLLGGIGLLGFAGGLALLAMLPEHAATIDIVWRMALCGFGYGFFQSPNNRAILSATPRERSAAASGMKQAARVVGQTTGASLAALIFTLNARGDNERRSHARRRHDLFLACRRVSGAGGVCQRRAISRDGGGG